MVTIDYMKLLMDSDCLIKLTKSGIKALVEKHCDIHIPKIVEWEVVHEGKKKECPDAYAVEKNIARGGVSVLQIYSAHVSGDEALIDLYPESDTDAVATDDAKLIRILRANGIPYMLPALIIYELTISKSISIDEANSALERLSDYISRDEYSAVAILLENIK